jgi:hypothetical protein
MAYLNEDAFRMRGVVTMVLWTILAGAYWRWSTSQDDSRDPLALTHRMRWFAPITIILFALSLTFGAAIDWLMSLDPHWFSTVFGVYYFAGCVVSVHAFIALAVILLHRSGYLRGVVTPEHFHDLGKMMFAFTVFWAYIGFSQFMLIWYANVPEETAWFKERFAGGWGDVAWTLVFGHFVFPFFGMLSRHIKRNRKTLAFFAVWMLAMIYLDMYWLVMPNVNEQPDFRLMDLLLVIGILSALVAAAAQRAKSINLVPTKDPRLARSLAFENI